MQKQSSRAGLARKEGRPWDARGWGSIAALFLMVFVCLGFCSSNKSIYLAAITEALDIKRSLFSISDSCRFVTTAIVNLFFGTLVGKFGTKKMIAAGFGALIVSSLLYAYAEHIYIFYLGGMFLGLGLSWTTTTMVGCVVHRRWPEHSGKIMGIVLAANGIGAAVATQIVSPIIYQEGNPFGYRDAYRLVAVILAVAAVLVLALFREKGAPEGAAAKHRPRRASTQWEGLEHGEIFKKPYFYFAAIGVFLTGMVLQGVSGISAAHMRDVGLDPAYVAIVVSVHSLTLTGFKFLSGVMHDRFGLRISIIISEAAAVLAIFLLAVLTNSAAGKAMAMTYAVLASLALPLETIMLPLITGDLFGNRSYDKMLGIMVSVNTAGYAVGAPLTNWSYDAMGSYKPMLLALCGVILVVTVVFQLVLNAAEREKRLQTKLVQRDDAGRSKRAADAELS